MTKDQVSTRRNFLKVGAILSAPLAALPVAALASDGSTVRLARLEDERAIRDLHQTWLRSVNARTASNKGLALGGAAEDNVHSIGARLEGPPDEIKIGADGKGATGCFHCAVELETPIAKNCTLAQMAHQQGGGFVRRTESRVLIVDYAKADGAWSIARVKLAQV